MHKITNNTGREMPNLISMVDKFISFAKEKMPFDKPIEVELASDSENGQILLGKTAYYDSKNYKICLYTDNRHPKDILRSLSHELMHHSQNCRGDFKNVNNLSDGYAQSNQHMRNLEQEAYEAAIILRDFEDAIDKEEKYSITLDEWKRREIFSCLTQKFVPGKKKTLKESKISQTNPEKSIYSVMSTRFKNNR